MDPIRQPSVGRLTDIDVLIVEDDAFNVRLLSEVCKTAGYAVRVAMDGIAALQAVDEKQPDLILLDVMIPRLDGLAVLENLRAREACAHLPIILVTAIQSEEQLLRGVDLGADDYIIKPFRIAELRQRIQSALEVRALVSQLA